MPDVTMPNGDVVSFPDDMPQDEIKGLIAKKFPDDVHQEQRPTSFVGALGALGQATPEGASYGFSEEVGRLGIGDALRAGALTMRGVPKEQLRPELQQMREQRQLEAQQRQEDYPISSMVGEGLGAAMTGVGGLGAAKAIPVGRAAIQKGAEFAARGLPQKALTSFGLGATGGSLYGAGTSPEDRGAGAVQGGLWGGSFGLASPVAFAAGGAGYNLGKQAFSGVGDFATNNPLTQKALSLFGKKQSRQPVTLQKTAQVPISDVAKTMTPEVIEEAGEESIKGIAAVQKALKSQFGSNYDAALDAYKRGDGSLSDLYTTRTNQLAEAAALYPSGRDIALREVGERIVDVPDRVMRSISKNISGVDAYHASIDDVLNMGRTKAKPIYKEAFKANRSVNSDRLNRILSTPAGKKALKDTATDFQNQMQLVAKPQPELTALAKELSDMDMMMEQKGGVSGGLKLEALDAIKKKLDKAYSAADKAKLGDASAADRAYAINQTRAALVSELDALDESGLYAKARASAGDYLRTVDAMEQGKDFAKQDAEIIKKTFQSLPENEKLAYKIGVGKSVRDQINNAREGVNPYTRLMGSKGQKDKLAAVLSPKEYKNLEKALEAEDKLFKFRNQVLSGSPTAWREEAKSLIESGAVDTLTGVPERTMTQAVGQIGRRLFDGYNDKTAKAVSKILYETDPVKKLEIVNSLTKQGLTKPEAKIVKEMYAVMAPRYDALASKYITAPLVGGQVGANIGEE